VVDGSLDKVVTSSSPTNVEFEPEAVREKYRGERDKRLRPDGNGQFPEIAGHLSRYLHDPHSDPTFVRDPMTDEVDVVIIGGGMGGLLVGAKLRDIGVKRIRVIEKGPTSAASGIGIDTRARSAISSPTSTSHYWRSWATCRKRNIPSHPKSGNTAGALAKSTTFTQTHASRPKLRRSVGVRTAVVGHLD